MARQKMPTNGSGDLDKKSSLPKSSLKPSPDQMPEATKRSYLRQSDVPIASLDEAMRIPQAIFDHYAGKSTTPFNVAKALNVDVKGSQIRVLSGAAMAFGLIEGGAQAASIGVTDLARRILRPKTENDDLEAKREAVLKPRIFGDFLNRYNGNQLPRKDIALNVLEELGVPRNKTEEVLERINESAKSVGFIQEIRGKYYVQINNLASEIHHDNEDKDFYSEENTDQNETDVTNELTHEYKRKEQAATKLSRGTAMSAAVADDYRRRRVFVTHGKDRALVDPIKKLLEYGELEPIVSVERQSVSKPVPEKVMDDMRKCGAAIIHVDADQIITDSTGQEHVILNPNVLIEIGAAMAFYGRRFILLVRNGVKLPSNLQGLFEVRYNGDTLDANATISLLEAMKDIKNYSLPTDDESE